jgi:hypothetical protein
MNRSTTAWSVTVTQNTHQHIEVLFLDEIGTTLCFYSNLRKRRYGRQQGSSAYESLTGTPVNDWLALLGFPPSKHIH